MRKGIPWSSIVGFLLLLALGIGVPFWLEYRSLTNPPPAGAAKKMNGREAIDAAKGVYCPNCGKNIALPERGGALERGSEPLPPLSLKALERPRWETVGLSTQAAPVPGPELHGNP